MLRRKHVIEQGGLPRRNTAQVLHLRELRGDEAAAAVDRTVAGRCREFDAYKSLVTSTQWFLSRHRAKGLG
jgi:hypothetical protein